MTIRGQDHFTFVISNSGGCPVFLFPFIIFIQICTCMAEKKGFFNFLKPDGIIEHFVALLESRIMIAKIEVKEEIAHILSRGLVTFALVFVATLFFLFLNFAFAFFVGSAMQNVSYGFLIVSGFYLMVFIILFLLKDRLGLDKYFEKKLSHALKIKK